MHLPTLFLFFVLVPAASAQVFLEDLTPEQRSAYEQARLYLEMRETVHVGAMRVGDHAVPVTSTSRKWVAYQGRTEVSEAEFFALAGREDLSRRARAHQSSATTLSVLGGLGLLAGAGLLTLGLIQDNSFSTDPFETGEGPNYALYIGGGAVALAGGAALSFGVNKGRRNAVHAGIASEVAEEYNQRLLIELGRQGRREPVRDTEP